MNSSEFCKDCLDLPTCEEIEEDDNDTEISDCDYKRKEVKPNELDR